MAVTAVTRFTAMVAMTFCSVTMATTCSAAEPAKTCSLAAQEMICFTACHRTFRALAVPPLLTPLTRLVGGDGNDHLFLGPGDIGVGGAGDDVFEIDHSRTDIADVSQINDFSPGDALEISYEPTFDTLGQPELPEITIERNNADDGEFILFNRVVIANVIGDQQLMPGDITLNPAMTR